MRGGELGRVLREREGDIKVSPTSSDVSAMVRFPRSRVVHGDSWHLIRSVPCPPFILELSIVKQSPRVMGFAG